MKRYFFLLLATIAFGNLQAQKLYGTKSGQIKFNASGGIEEIAAINNQVDSKFVDKNGQIVFSVLIKGFKFKNQLMEDHFNENYLESTQFPKAEFKGFIKANDPINYDKDGIYPITANGDLTLHGVIKKVEQTGTLSISAGKVTIHSNFKIKLKDYGITGLYIGEKIAPEATIELNCVYNTK
ncbi:MAG: YceI family protein [Chitinophagaceae bacterium]